MTAGVRETDQHEGPPCIMVCHKAVYRAIAAMPEQNVLACMTLQLWDSTVVFLQHRA